MKPTLTFNCPEKWENMKIGVVSRYCENCQKDVHDFTTMSREDILHYLWTHRNKQVCGRLWKSQLDYHHEEILITVESFLKKNRNSNLAFYVLAASALMLLGCTDDKGNAITSQQGESAVCAGSPIEMSVGDTVEIRPQNNPVILNDIAAQVEFPEGAFDPLAINLDELELAQLPMLGMMTMVPEGESIYPGGGVCRRLTEVMPEFESGYDGLIAFMKERLQYPEWEKKNKLEGIVYVSFVIDEQGRVTEPEIVKTVPNAMNFDSEVLRVVSEMPDWIPGRELGQNVAVEFTLPVKFKL
jgi:TonB family protein